MANNLKEKSAFVKLTNEEMMAISDAAIFRISHLHNVAARTIRLNPPQYHKSQEEINHLNDVVTKIKETMNA